CIYLDDHYQYSHILKMIDKSTSLAGDYLTFIFAIENRIPVLDYIDESVDINSEYSKYLNSNYGNPADKIYNDSDEGPSRDQYNLIVDAGDTIMLYPFGIDPDDESVKYNYSGWKTPIKIYNTTGAEYEDPTQPPGFTISDDFSGGPNEPSNIWETTVAWENGVALNPKYKDAEYTTDWSGSDNGYHWVRINVTDSEGFHDYQDIKILVR
ncbi:MAG: hypothetical protein ABIJ08_01830, partial [Nanoarchaeota archaeon]